MTDRSVVFRLRAEIGSFVASMAQASASTKKAAGEMTSLTKEGEKSRRGLTSLGNVAGGVGLVAAAGLGAAVVKAADFDASMSKVQAATHESAAAMRQLRQAALDAGADTAFSANEAAGGIEALAKAGVTTQEILQGGLMGALDLAAAGEMEVADAAEAAAGAMAQFKLDGEDVPHIADLLAAGAGKAQGEVSDMVMALKQAGTVSSQTGLTLEETTGALAAMAEQSLLGSDAGTSFKQMLASLTPNSAKAAEAMDEIGFSAFDAKGNFIGMTELAGELQTSLAGMTDEQRAATLETIFGSDAVRAASIIYDNGAEGIADWTAKVDDAGFAAETAAIKQDNLRGDLEKLGGSLETALIGTGEGAQGPLRSLVQGTEDLVDAFNKLPGPAKDVTAGLLGITAILGGGAWFGTKVITGIASTKTALDNLGVSAGTTKRAMSNIGTGMKVGGALVALRLVSDALDALDKGVNESDLGRNLEALAGGGDVSDDLQEVGKDIRMIAMAANSATEPLAESASLFGLMGDTNLDKAQANIEKIDQALAAMVEAGDEETAGAVFAQFQQQAVDAGVSAEDAAASFDAYGTALDNIARGGPPEGIDHIFGNAAGIVQGVAGAVDVLDIKTKAAKKSADRHADAVEREAEALKKSRDAARETGDAFFGIGEKVDKAKVSLGEWLRDLEKQADALRNFRINAETAAKKGLDEGLIKSLQEAGPAGALRMKQLADATDEEIDRANKAWRRGQREINLYTDAVGGVKPPKPVKPDVDIDPAVARIRRLEERLRELRDRFKEPLTLRVTSSGAKSLSPGFGPQLDMWTGGWTGPGGKYQPKGVVHGNEYVFSSEATSGNVAMLERLHRQLRGYAQGGLVQRHAAAAPVVLEGGGRVDIDYQRLAQSLATVRPLYGDVHWHGSYDDYKRMARADRQAAGLGGH